MRTRIRLWACIAIAVLSTNAIGAQGGVSSLAIGFYDSDEKPLLGPAFMNAVNNYLRRYEPRLIERGPGRVRMQADYDFIYDIELIIKADEYEIVVSLAEMTGRYSKAQKAAAKLSAGVLRAMEKELMRGSRVRSKTTR